ncbi:MAG TPA: ABC transporter ATP-binding protein [Rhodopila sp.]
MSLLSIENLTVAYETERGPLQALDRVDLTIGAGEVVGLVGESGSGKSTLASAVLGILPRNVTSIRDGRIMFEGRDLLELPERTVRSSVRGQRITLVPQDPFGSLDPLFRIGAQFNDLMRWKSPGQEHGRARRALDRAAILRALADVQIPNPEAVLEKLPGELSGGQRQRVLIAMALLPEPRLIVADEPTTALDVTIQAQVLKLLLRLVRDRGVSVLFTTHDLGVASEICDRIVVMYAGQALEAAPTQVFFRAPQHPYSARLLGSLPKAGRLPAGIPGDMPALIDPPSGCRFRTRCDRASAICAGNIPTPIRLAGGHEVRCFHPIQRMAA